MAGICRATNEPWRQRVCCRKYPRTQLVISCFPGLAITLGKITTCTTGFQPFTQATLQITITFSFRTWYLTIRTFIIFLVVLLLSTWRSWKCRIRITVLQLWRVYSSIVIIVMNYWGLVSASIDVDVWALSKVHGIITLLECMLLSI